MTHAGSGDRRGQRGRWATWGAVLLAGLLVGVVTFLVALAVGSSGDPADDPSGRDAVDTAETSESVLTTVPDEVVARRAATSDVVTDRSEPPLAGVRIALDPGHNGANGRNPALVNALVPDGRGGTKACNTVGASTAAGYPEHAFNWDVSERAAAGLEALGADVVRTRADDTGVGPCVDERGTVGQDHDADLVVSVHANGSTDTSLRGFFVVVADPPGDPQHEAESLRLAEDLVEALADAGFPPSPVFAAALSSRGDLATLNHARRPAVLVELGEMRNAEEAAVMESTAGRQRYADAIVAGVVRWATGAPVTP
ncbi:N-acetylmuramoyl-L-alanine amidase [Oerskovia flava]|uniref:N-acetylmuramoyl-L-alanine amidase n=1 Tax=Oerskovia flava TaxID=2986422 RepID=UPI00223ED1EB|nr:N-acetylmuramoyl-L-alanine amidase [Oerskovia sp. JB1-3-2]